MKDIKTWQDVLLEITETDPADISDRSNICISQKDLRDILKAAMDGQEVLRIPAQWLDSPDGPLLGRLSLAAAGAMLDKGFSGLTRDDLDKCNCSNVGRKVVQALANHARKEAALHTTNAQQENTTSTR